MATNPGGPDSLSEIARKNAAPGALTTGPTEAPAVTMAPGKYDDPGEAARVKVSPSKQRPTPFKVGK